MSEFAKTRRESRQAFISAYPFELVDGGGLGVELDLTTSSGTSSRTALVGTGEQALITNDGPYAGRIRFGDSTVVATTACVSIVPGIPYTLTIPEGATHVAGITRTGTANIQITLGHGN